jgi:hypothetical protein
MVSRGREFADLADMTLHDDAARNVKTRAGALANLFAV